MSLICQSPESSKSAGLSQFRPEPHGSQLSLLTDLHLLELGLTLLGVSGTKSLSLKKVLFIYFCSGRANPSLRAIASSRAFVQSIVQFSSSFNHDTMHS